MHRRPLNQHSVLAVFRKLLERMFPHWGEKNRIEMFARTTSEGWTVDR